MKKIILSILILFLLCGCGKDKAKILANLENEYIKLNSYYIEGEMIVVNNEDTYKYNIKVSHMDDEYYKINLINTNNNHEQIILKNDDGVFVITPSLNKSFKFESKWPNTNSQSYLPESVLNDLKTDTDVTLEEIDDNYVFTSKVNYPNNKKLTKQKVYVKDNNITKVEVLDDKDNIVITMNYNSTSKNHSLELNDFKLDTTKTNDDTNNEASTIDNVILPMFLPENTTLESEKSVSLNDKERVILTFSGDNPFIIIEETVSKSDEFEIIPTVGDPMLILDTIGSISDNSVSWISNGLEYYIASDVMNMDDIIEVANSMSTIPVIK